MTEKNSMPVWAIAQTENAVFESDNEIREPVHKKDARAAAVALIFAFKR